jgi:hypothetical protein
MQAIAPLAASILPGWRGLASARSAPRRDYRVEPAPFAAVHGNGAPRIDGHAKACPTKRPMFSAVGHASAQCHLLCPSHTVCINCGSVNRPNRKLQSGPNSCDWPMPHTFCDENYPAECLTRISARNPDKIRFQRARLGPRRTDSCAGCDSIAADLATALLQSRQVCGIGHDWLPTIWAEWLQDEK